MKLYHSARSRSVRPRWLLEELGEPYELVTFVLSEGHHKKPEYLAIHPHGSVPALEDGEVTLFESAAICAYLADKYPDQHMAPPLGSAARGKYYQWMFYSIATLEAPILQIFLHTVQFPPEQRSQAVVDENCKKFAEIAKVLGDTLANRSFILGEQISAADIMLGSSLVWAKFLGVLEDAPESLKSYVDRLAARPAFVRAHTD